MTETDGNQPSTVSGSKPKLPVLTFEPNGAYPGTFDVGIQWPAGGSITITAVAPPELDWALAECIQVVASNERRRCIDIVRAHALKGQALEALEEL